MLSTVHDHPQSSNTLQVSLRCDPGGMHLHLPDPNLSWQECWDQVMLRLQSSRPFWPGSCPLTLWASTRDLDPSQLQLLDAQLSLHRLSLQRVRTQSRSTAIAAASLGYSVDQRLIPPPPPTPTPIDPLYLRTTLRSGTEIRHNATVVVLGDANPGSEIIAGGDILVWGRLRGLVHAGAQGDQKAVILAVQLEPTQLRIAHQVARPPEDAPPDSLPEVAYLKDDLICIASIQDFLRRRV